MRTRYGVTWRADARPLGSGKAEFVQNAVTGSLLGELIVRLTPCRECATLA
jgi:hypothetical protein